MKDKWWKKYFLYCPDCSTRLEYWKPIKNTQDIPAWYCRKCPNLWKQKGDIIKL